MVGVTEAGTAVATEEARAAARGVEDLEVMMGRVARVGAVKVEVMAVVAREVVWVVVTVAEKEVVTMAGARVAGARVGARLAVRAVVVKVAVVWVVAATAMAAAARAREAVETAAAMGLEAVETAREAVVMVAVKEVVATAVVRVVGATAGV
jgi:hypothetical protein